MMRGSEETDRYIYVHRKSAVTQLAFTIITAVREKHIRASGGLTSAEDHIRFLSGLLKQTNEDEHITCLFFTVSVCKLDIGDLGQKQVEN